MAASMLLCAAVAHVVHGLFNSLLANSTGVAASLLLYADDTRNSIVYYNLLLANHIGMVVPKLQRSVFREHLSEGFF